MRAVLQRVTRASVEVAGECVGRIGRGWLVLLGVARGDTDRDADWMAEKVANLRAFEDEQGKMNRSVAEAGGGVLVVSQFTLLADCRAGRRPSFTEAANPAEAERLYLRGLPTASVPQRPPTSPDGHLSGHDEGRAGQRRAGDVPAR